MLVVADEYQMAWFRIKFTTILKVTLSNKSNQLKQRYLAFDQNELHVVKIVEEFGADAVKDVTSNMNDFIPKINWNTFCGEVISQRLQ